MLKWSTRRSTQNLIAHLGLTVLFLLVMSASSIAAGPSAKLIDSIPDQIKDLNKAIEAPRTGLVDINKRLDDLDSRLIKQEERLVAQGNMINANATWAIGGVALLSVVVTIFGGLITAIVIWFGFRTTVIAEAEAKRASSDALSNIQKEIEAQKQELFQATEKTMKLFDESSNKHQKLGDIVAKIKKQLNEKIDDTLKVIEEKTNEQKEIITDHAREVFNKQFKNTSDTSGPNEQYTEMLSSDGKIDSVNNTNFELIFKQALSLIELDNFKPAIEKLKEALLIASSDVEIAKVHYFTGFAYTQLGDHEKAAESDQIILSSFTDKLGADSDPALEFELARAHLGYALDLIALSRIPEALDVLDTTVRLFGESNNPDIQLEVCRSLNSKAYQLFQAENYKDAIKTYEDLENRFSHFEGLEFQAQVTESIVDKALAYKKDNKSVQSISELDKVISKYNNRQEEEIKAEVARALNEKANILKNLGKKDEFLSILNKIISSYPNPIIADLAVQIARAFMNKANYYREIKKYKASWILYNEFLEKFQSSGIQELKRPIARAKLYRIKRKISLGWKSSVTLDLDKFISEYQSEEDETIVKLVEDARALRTEY